MKRLAPLLLALAAGCAAQTHIGEYKPKRREYESPPAAASDKEASPGSLWRDGRSASLLFTDARALRENDLVVVKVEEIADAKRSADTELTHNSQIAAFAALMKAQGVATTTPQLSIESSVQNGFTGDGSTGRTERFVATVPAIVRKVLPNGNLFVEGHRVILVNAEEHHFYISGVVRPIDIDGDNSVKSSMVADAEIEFTGRGILTDNQKQGWFQRWFGWIWPF
ncbi:flagellar basal body L-ring protein FlgH [Anaeromyxobacter paludicola]|uniref:Flagellar L-ring protein n=1 Tax=Anaeromyxobacter paludicola TaxID=2918171 RepID=A0ABM7X861_9BACT|nr:flagellar basal body L-ring protein FlgH [Anaeromyxobacter paludicola]BDG08007.1 flagellar L-ring protein [Anaeromyxobacter paludicola]